jgi:hypothetical protein
MHGGQPTSPITTVPSSSLRDLLGGIRWTVPNSVARARHHVREEAVLAGGEHHRHDAVSVAA